MSKNLLLLIALVIYLIPIIYIYIFYDNNNSISSIISDEKSKYIILFFMLLMGLAIILYEHNRNNIYSLVTISILLLSIYGLIYFNEGHVYHCIFSCIAFFSIILFMCIICININIKNSNILPILLLIEIILFIFILKEYNNGSIFLYETFYLLNFAIFYLLVHFI
jgi:hypothetical membrane protein